MSGWVADGPAAPGRTRLWRLGPTHRLRQRRDEWGNRAVKVMTKPLAFPLLSIGELEPVETHKLLIWSECAHNDGRTFQERGEARNDVADKMRQLMKRWDKSISPTNRRFGQHFIA